MLSERATQRLFRFLRSAFGLLKLQARIAGRKRRVLFRLTRPFVRASGHLRIPHAGAELHLDLAHDNERLLAMALPAVLRAYTRKPLGRLLQRVLKPGDVFLDIGANLGVFGWVAQRAGAEVVAFDPDPRCAAFMARNRHIFGEVHQVALADTNGEQVFHLAGFRNPGGGTLMEKRPGHANSIRVQVRRFDDLNISPSKLARVKFCKIDVEGAEILTLRGMHKLLSNAPPHIFGARWAWPRMSRFAA